MTTTICRADDRDRVDFGWIVSQRTVPTDRPAGGGFGPLLGVSDDRFCGGAGFGDLFVRDVLIVACVLAGTIRYRDSLGNAFVVGAGSVLGISAGTGLRRSAYNAAADAPAHAVAFRFAPGAIGLAAGCTALDAPAPAKRGRLHLVGDRHGGDGRLALRRDLRLHVGTFAAGEAAALTLAPGRLGWVQAATGAVVVNGERLAAGDGAAIDGGAVALAGLGDDAEVIVFDMAP